MKIIDRPWAIVYGPKAKMGNGLMYGLGNNRADAWANAILVYYGTHAHGGLEFEKKKLQRKGMVARKVEVRL